jgi:RNA polymerase sigma-70 factor, ECF subfamily
MSSSRPDTAGEVDLTSWRDEQLLVERVRAGDPLAFEAIFRRFHPELLTFAASIVGSRAAAEDVVQDVFLAIWALRQRWRITTSVRPYLFRAVHNTAVRNSSSAVVRRTDSLDATTSSAIAPPLIDPAPSAHDQAEANEMAEKAERIVASLPPRAREVYALSRREGLSTREIAERLGISPKTVELHMTRALSTLRSGL